MGALLVLLSTFWQVLTGTQTVSDTGELARFGVTSFQILAPLQLAATLFFAALSAAGAVAVEKDRRTLDLLLLTRLSNVELVLGKLFSSLLIVVSLVLAALPLFMLVGALGGRVVSADRPGCRRGRGQRDGCRQPGHAIGLLA